MPLNVITGASRGVGAALAEALPGETVGTSTAGGDLVRLDVRDPDGFGALRDAVGDRPVDVLVCNAGVLPDRGETLDGYAPDLWTQGFEVNVRGVFLTVQALLPNLRAARGKIAVISSQLGSSEIASGGMYVYRASKAAALNLGRNLAVDLKADGIAVGIYHPGWVRTDMGGSSAAISAEESAAGLAQRITDLDLGGTGAFETYDGTPHPF